MSKIKVTSVNGPAVDVSFPGTDQQTGQPKTVPCFEIPCSGTVDGVESDFNIKVFSQRNAALVKAGFAPIGDVQGREYQGVWSYSCKKEHFPQQPGAQGGGKWGGGKTFVPRDVEREEAAKFPTFALSYAKDIVVALVEKGQVEASSHDNVATTNSISELTQLLAAHNLSFLRKNAAKAPAAPATTTAGQAPTQTALPAKAQPADPSTVLWAKLQKEGVKEEAQQAGVTVNMLKTWWGECQQSDLMFIKRVHKEVSAAGGSQEEPPTEERGNDSEELPF